MPVSTDTVDSAKPNSHERPVRHPPPSLGGVYTTKTPAEVSWHQEQPDVSLGLIDELDVPKDAAIIDLGCGASTQAETLLTNGHTDITVLDVSAAALEAARAPVIEIRAFCTGGLKREVLRASDRRRVARAGPAPYEPVEEPGQSQALPEEAPNTWMLNRRIRQHSSRRSCAH